MFRSVRETGAGLLVRSDRGRQRRVITDGGTRELWDFMAAQPALGARTITISACGGPRSGASPARPVRLLLDTVLCRKQLSLPAWDTVQAAVWWQPHPVG